MSFIGQLKKNSKKSTRIVIGIQNENKTRQNRRQTKQNDPARKALHQQGCREFVLPLIALSPLSTIFPIFDFIVID
jgi:hypothetical protein